MKKHILRMLGFDVNVLLLFLVVVKIRVILCNYVCLGLCFYFIKVEKSKKNSHILYRLSPVIKHFWLFDGELSIVILFMFWVVTGTLTALDYNLIIFMFKIFLK